MTGTRELVHGLSVTTGTVERDCGGEQPSPAYCTYCNVVIINVMSVASRLNDRASTDLQAECRCPIGSSRSAYYEDDRIVACRSCEVVDRGVKLILQWRGPG